MPKSYKRKRGSTGRKRSYHKRYRPIRKFVRKRKSLALKQHAFCERAENTQEITINTEAAATGLFETFSLSKIRNEAEYAAIFEYYRIDKVVATFRYKGGKSDLSTVANNWLLPTNEVNPLLYFKVDHNDHASDSLDTMKDSMKTKTHMFTNNNPEFSIQLRPATLAQVYKSGSPPNEVTVTTPKWGQWLSTTDNDLVHNGLKCYAIGHKDAQFNPGTLSVSFKYYVSFKNNE